MPGIEEKINSTLLKDYFFEAREERTYIKSRVNHLDEKVQVLSLRVDQIGEVQKGAIERLDNIVNVIEPIKRLDEHRQVMCSLAKWAKGAGVTIAAVIGFLLTLKQLGVF